MEASIYRLPHVRQPLDFLLARVYPAHLLFSPWRLPRAYSGRFPGVFMKLNRWSVPCLVALVVSLPLSAEEKKAEEKKAEKVVTEKDNDTTVQLSKGETLLVKLRVQGGTGYTWVVAGNSDTALAQGKPSTEKVAGAAVGGPVLMVFPFTARGEGQSKLELHYKRPFEKEKEPARKVKFTVTVK